MKYKFINKSAKLKCHKCNGKGWHRERDVAEECLICNGTGKWTEDNFILVATTPEGQQIAFQSDWLGK